jgi:hypothetical protein
VRPTKLTAALIEKIAALMRAGNYAEQACRAVGIATSTYYRWIERGRREQFGIYHDFVEALRRAEAEAEVEAVVLLREAMPDDWRAIVAYLERRYPGRWRRHSTTALVGADGAHLAAPR